MGLSPRKQALTLYGVTASGRSRQAVTRMGRGGRFPLARGDESAQTRPMRSRTTVVVVAALTVVSTAVAAPPTPTPQPAPGTPPILTNVGPLLTGVEVLSKNVDEGALSFRLDFSNPSRQAQSREVWVSVGTTLANQGRVQPFAKVTLTIPAGGADGSVTFSDPRGISTEGTRACVSFDYALSWGGRGSLGKRIVTNPSCAFTTKGTDPLAIVPPDTLQAQRQNKAYYFGAQVTTEPRCSDSGQGGGSPLNVAATLKNGTSATAKLKLLFDTDLTPPVEGGVTQLAPGATGTAGASSFQLRSGRRAVKIVDPQNSVNGAIFQPGYFVDVKRTCNPTAKLVAE